MSDVTSESAGWVIDDIRRRNGGVSDEDRAATPAGVLQALDALREDLFYRITTIGTPGSKLIVHLISRTSRLAYDRAEARGENGYLEFTLAKDHLMIDSNDNGYCGEAITELCRYPFSKKCPLFTQKEVLGAFQIGTKIHIQSGPFSFSFQYTQGNNMMDKLTPNREQSESLPSNVYSRITISCLHPGQFERLANDFRGLRTNGFLLFDSKCTVLRFKIGPPDANYDYINYQITNQESRMTLTKISKAVPLRQSYHVFTRNAKIGPTGLFVQKSGNRISFASPKIYLAFPIDQESKALLGLGGHFNIDGNCVLLPGDNQFNFVLCVSYDNHNAQEIPDGLAEFISTFLCDKMAFLSSQQPLQYEWVQYIPQADVVSRKWKVMLNHLYNRLKGCKLYKSERGTTMDLSSLRYLEPEHCDQHGRPLFPDLDQEIYLSTRYSPYLEFLKHLGIRKISNDELLDRIKAYYGPETQAFNHSWGDWRVRVARLLRSWLEKDASSPLATEIKELRFLSLFDGPVVRAVDCLDSLRPAEPSGSFCIAFKRRDVWLPFDTNGNFVPALPNICRIYEHDTPDSESTKLYDILGIHHPHPQQVIDKIKAWTHSSEIHKSVWKLRDALLYIHANTGEVAASKVPCLPMIDEQNNKVIPKGKMTQCYCDLRAADVYFPSEQDYGISEIAAKLNLISFAPKIHILNAGLLRPRRIRRRNKPVSSPEWVSWLENVALVRRVPRLQDSRDPNRLSEIFESIIKHYPEMFLEVLRSHWPTYASELVPGLVSTIEEVPVPTLYGNKVVSECYLLTPELRVIALKVFGSTMDLPFLRLSEGFFNEEIQSRWDFLSVFGVVTEPTPKFFVGIYDQIVGKTPLNDAASEFQALYTMLSERPLHEKARFFNTKNVIYIPRGKNDAKLAPIDDCVWNGPCWLEASHALSHIKEYSENSRIQLMLRATLKTIDAGLWTYIKELRHQQSIIFASLPQVRKIYARLCEDRMEQADLTSMRELFKKHRLVYDPIAFKWYTPQECIWAVSSDEGKIPIALHYPGSRVLFSARLLVEDPMIAPYIMELNRIASRKDSNINELLSTIQKMIDIPLSLSDIDLLSRIKFLPIAGVDQGHYFASPREDFFIVDLDGWPCNFRGIVPTLRFNVDQVQRIRSFLVRLGLDKRFITIAGLKETFVSKERKIGSPELTCDFQDRAIALCRCATFYAGDNDMPPLEMYDVFRTTLIYESPEITTRCTIQTADGAQKSIQIPTWLHVQYENGELQIVIPKDIVQRQICYATQLPETLASLFSTNSPVARGTFATILRESVNDLDVILFSYGIPELSGLDPGANVPVEPEASREELDETCSTPSTVSSGEIRHILQRLAIDTDSEYSFESEASMEEASETPF